MFTFLKSGLLLEEKLAGSGFLKVTLAGHFYGKMLLSQHERTASLPGMQTTNSDSLALYFRSVLGVDSVVLPAPVALLAAMPEVPPEVLPAEQAYDQAHVQAHVQADELNRHRPQVQRHERQLKVTGDFHQANLLVFASSARAEFAFDGEAGDLARKIVQAMKISIDQVCFVEWNWSSEQAPDDVFNWLEQVEGRMALVFGRETFVRLVGEAPTLGLIQKAYGVGFMATHDLADLLKAAPLKKETWSHVQLLLSRLPRV